MGLNYMSERKEYDDLKVREVSCRTALSPSGLEADYALNPYRGCSHGCEYCYSPFVIREEREWGSFVDVKRNIPKVLAKELKNKTKGIVRLGSVTDPYQKVEEDYEITRMCLEQLAKHDFPILVQTKSDLVTRDIDIYSEIDADVGMTITSLDEDFRKKFEPDAPSIDKRISALEELVDSGVHTWAFIGPLLPYHNDGADELKKLSERLNEVGVNEIYLDKLNMRKGIWERMEKILDEDIIKKYEEIFFESEDYFEDHRELYKKIGRPVF